MDNSSLLAEFIQTIALLWMLSWLKSDNNELKRRIEALEKRKEGMTR